MRCSRPAAAWARPPDHKRIEAAVKELSSKEPPEKAHQMVVYALEATGTATDAQQILFHVRQLSLGGLFSNIRFNYRETDKGVEFTLLLKPRGGAQ